VGWISVARDRGSLRGEGTGLFGQLSWSKLDLEDRDGDKVMVWKWTSAIGFSCWRAENRLELRWLEAIRSLSVSGAINHVTLPIYIPQNIKDSAMSCSQHSEPIFL
jgi:hypothetical protein